MGWRETVHVLSLAGMGGAVLAPVAGLIVLDSLPHDRPASPAESAELDAWLLGLSLVTAVLFVASAAGLYVSRRTGTSERVWQYRKQGE